MEALAITVWHSRATTLTDDQLSAAIQSKRRGTFLRPVVQQDLQHTIERYHNVCRAQARIDPQILEPPKHRVDLIFKIKEGERTSGSRFETSARHSVFALSGNGTI
jgi:outer membrane protein assembly factor BamA